MKNSICTLSLLVIVSVNILYPMEEKFPYHTSQCMQGSDLIRLSLYGSMQTDQDNVSLPCTLTPCLSESPQILEAESPQSHNQITQIPLMQQEITKVQICLLIQQVQLIQQLLHVPTESQPLWIRELHQSQNTVQELHLMRDNLLQIQKDNV